MLRILPFLLVVLFTLFSCSSDNGNEQPDPMNEGTDPMDEPMQEEMEEEPAEPDDPSIDVSVFYENEGTEYQVDINSDIGIEQTEDLSNSLGITPVEFSNFSNRVVDERSVSFYSWYSTQTNVFQKDISDGMISSLENYCALAEEPNVTYWIEFATGNLDYLYYVYYRLPDRGSFSYFVKIFNKTTGQCSDVELPMFNAPVGVVSSIIEGDVLAVNYRREDNSAIPIVVLIDLATGTLIEALEFDDQFQAATFRDTELILINKDRSYQIYDTESRTFTSNGTAMDLPLPLETLFNTKFNNTQLLSVQLFAGPSSQIFIPVIYDLDAETVVAGGGFFSSDLEIAALEQFTVVPFYKTYDVDIESDIVVIGYENRLGGGKPGGVIFANFDLEFLKVIELDFIPEDIILRAIR